MSNLLIANILNAQLATVSTLPTLAQENIVTQARNGVAFCRTTLLPAATQVMSIGTGGRERYYGNFQIDLYYPNQGGYTDAFTMAANVIAAFPKGTYYTDGVLTVLILRAYQLSARSFPNNFNLPIVVEYEDYI